ncbi:NAD(P)-binding protein [Zopfia rhizophila CBS 207.26]|uniref:NAD(P)-binding protein n=1 Tax=Zopfia rhizophila CBS 207.26 TaxID=1314779 RepID=A0A6A6E8W8_9PEZI|nr:NAD(P)-binding protein [Zopfia rhizophila CBS 207.26]
MSWVASVAAIVRQSFFIANPSLTEQNLPDQTGKVHIVTGGYSGCGQQLVKILYQKNAAVYVAGRSEDKALASIESIKREFTESNGRLEFLRLDLANHNSIRASAQEFMLKEQRLDVLTNNAGIMDTKEGSRDISGHEIHLGTNCLGPFLFSELLLPILCNTASSSSPYSVRVTWASSLAAVFLTPERGIEFDADGNPKVNGVYTNYGVSKVGNWFLAAEFARRYGKEGILSVAWNPGNLSTELQRHVGILRRKMVELFLFPAVYGAYTELYAGWSTDLTAGSNGAYVYPWGRIGTSTLRADLLIAAQPREERGTGEAGRFWEWCDKETRQFR